MIVGQHMRQGVGNNSHTLYLLQSDTTDGSTTFVDSSRGGTPHTLSAAANATHSTAQTKLGGKTSVHLTATGDMVVTPDHDDFTLGNYDFCMDLWIRPSDIGHNRNVMGQILAGQKSALIYQALNAAGYIISPNGNTTTGRTSSDTFLINTWHHICFLRVNGTFKLYLDGVHQSAADLYSGTARHDSTADFTVGHSTLGFNGYAVECRLTKHMIPYPVSGFTPSARMN